MKILTSSYFAASCASLLAFSSGTEAYEQSTMVCISAQSPSTVYFVESIYVSTYVQQNTTFNVNNYLTLTVDNAPTSLDEIVVGTSTTIINGALSG